MTFLSEHRDFAAAGDWLRNASTVTPELVGEVIDVACPRFSSVGQRPKTAHIAQLIDARAWIDVALALIDLGLPLWHIRRIAYDAGEWYCALSRQRELPDWLDQSIEGRHPDLALAILAAFVEAQRATASSSTPSVPAVPRKLDADHIPFWCENFA
jgi:hypothetical protein